MERRSGDHPVQPHAKAGWHSLPSCSRLPEGLGWQCPFSSSSTSLFTPWFSTQMLCSVMLWCYSASSFWGMPGVKQEFTSVLFPSKTAAHPPTCKSAKLQDAVVTHWCLRHHLSRSCQEENLQEPGHVLQGQMISGCNSMVPGTATVLGSMCCLTQPGKCNYGKNTAGMAATGEGGVSLTPPTPPPLFALAPVSLLLFLREIKCIGQVCV